MKHIRRKVFRCTGRKVEVSRQIVYRRRSRKLCCSENMRSMSQNCCKPKRWSCNSGWRKEERVEKKCLYWPGNLQAAAALSRNEILPDNSHGFTNNAIDNTWLYIECNCWWTLANEISTLHLKAPKSLAVDTFKHLRRRSANLTINGQLTGKKRIH